MVVHLEDTLLASTAVVGPKGFNTVTASTSHFFPDITCIDDMLAPEDPPFRCVLADSDKDEKRCTISMLTIPGSVNIAS